MHPPITIRPLASDDDSHWCAELMAGSEPWVTLGRNYDACRAVVDADDREVHLAVTAAGERLGFVVLVLRGAFVGYLQSIAVSGESRGQGIGGALLEFTESRIAEVSPNVFLCVSSFNAAARRLYERRGYTHVGTLTDYLVPGHDELLLRKSLGPWRDFVPGTFSKGSEHLIGISSALTP